MACTYRPDFYATLLTSVKKHLLLPPPRRPSLHVFDVLQDSAQVLLPLKLSPPVLAESHLGTGAYLVKHFPHYTGHLEDWGPALFSYLPQAPAIMLT